MRKKDSRGSVLVLGSDTRSFLSVVRSLGRYGLHVDAAWVNPKSISLGSRYLREVHQLPTPWEHVETWLQPFNELLELRQFDLVIPCNDPSLIPLQLTSQSLSRPDRIYLLEDNVFRITQSKVASTELASSLGISVPRNVVVAEVSEGLRFAADVDYPVVLKPTQSYQTEKLQRKQMVVTVGNENSLTANLQRMLESGNVQAQEHFQGVGTGVEFLAKAGRVQYAFQHLRLHEPQAGGGSSYRTGIPLHHEMLDATNKIVAALRYSGVGMVEFRWNPKTGKWIFVEINGRFWGSLPLALASKADFPKFLYQSRVEGIETFPANYRSGICCRNWERDKSWVSEQMAAAGGPIALVGKLSNEAALGAWRTITFRERSDTFSLDDPWPAVLELGEMTSSVVAGIGSRGRRWFGNLPAVRNWEKKRALRLLANATKILFVCKGNICRSPLAEAYSRGIFPRELEIRSSGYFPKQGRESPILASEAAARLGIDLQSHRSSMISQCDVDECEIIFVFDSENRRTLTSKFHGIEKKVFLLGVFSDGQVEIQDPYGGDQTRFDHTYKQIVCSLDKISTNLGFQNSKR